MADEGISIAVGEGPVQPSDHEKKRKLEDLETNAPEPLVGVDSASKTAPESEENAEEADESELKRPRLVDNKNNNGRLDGLASENGYQGRDNVDESEEPEEQKSNKQTLTKEESVLEDGDDQEKAPEALPSAEVEQMATGDQQSGDNEEPSCENEKPKTENEEGIPKGGDVQELSTDVTQDGSDTQTTSRKMEVPNNKVGVLIGKAGDTIRYLQYNSGAKIQIMRDADADPRSATRPVELIGTLESISKAEKLINDVIAEADAGGSPSLVARGFSTVQSVVGDQIEIQVPNEKVGLIIGKGGETIKNLQTRSGARIQLVPQHLPAGDQSKERTVRVTGDRKQIEVARDLIKEVMNQNVRPSPLSGGYSQQAFRPRGPVAPQWGSRGPHPAPFMGYDYQQRGPYPSQNPQYPPQSYGNYPPQQAPRSSFGPSWEQRPPSAMHAPQGNYNYGQPHGQDYGQPTPFPQAPAQSYGQGYSEMKYDSQVPAQHPYGGHGVPQQTGYPQGGGPHPGYGPQDQYGRSTSYGMHPQAPHGQSYGQPRPAQPGEMPYQAPVASTQAYGSNVPLQQSYPYASSGPMQQSYPPYGSAPATDGYSHPQPASATAPGYPQPGGPSVSGYGQTGVQQPSVYSAGGPTAGYGSYPSQPGYAEQAAATNTGYGYQASADPAYAAAGSTTYGAPTAPQPGYVQPAATQPGYDQSNVQSAGYGAAPVPAPAAYGKSASPQPGYPQYDSSQMYGAPR